MEEEQLFLFVVYSLEEVSCYYNETSRTEERKYAFGLKRASMQKYPRRDGEKFARIPIEFDPLNNQQCYVVTIFYNSKEKGRLFIGHPKFPLITLSLQEAQEEVEKINKNPKQYCSKDEAFTSVVILPTLISLQ